LGTSLIQGKVISNLKNFSSYAIGTLLQGISSFILLPLFSKYLTPTEYGTYSLVFMISTYLGSFFYLGANSSVTRFYFEEKNELNIKKVITNSGIIALAGIILYIIFAMTCSRIIAVHLIKNEASTTLIKLSIFSSILSIINTYFFTILRAKKMAIKFLVANAASFIITIFTTLIFFKYDIYKEKIYIPFVASIVGFLISNSFLFKVFFRDFILNLIDRRIILEYLKFSFPIVLTGVIYYFVDLADRLVLNQYFSTKIVGIYSFGYKIGMLIHLFFIVPFGMVYHTLRMEMTNSINETSFVSSIVNFFIITGFIIIILFLSNLNLFYYLFFTKNEYFESLKVVPFIMLGHLFYGLVSILDHGIYLSKKSFHYIWINILTLIFNLALNILFIPIYGMIGAAYATTITYLFMALLILFVSSRYFKFNIDYYTISIISLISMMFIFSINFTNLLKSYNSFGDIISYSIKTTIVSLAVIFFIFKIGYYKTIINIKYLIN